MEYNRGDVILDPKQYADEVFLILEGRVHISVNSKFH